MLKQRILTAMILIPAVLAAIFMLPSQHFAWVMALVVLIAAWEWSDIMGVDDLVKRLAYVCLVALLQFAVFMLSAVLAVNVLTVDVFAMAAALLWWSLAFWWVIKFPQSSVHWGRRTGVKALMGLLVLIPAWLALVRLQTQDPWWVMYVMAIVWGADTGAYFAGRKWGQRKLAPQVSPGKSIEGVLGGLLVCIILAAVVAVQIELTFYKSLSFVLFSGFVCLVSVLGDLLESMMKRQRGIKDSGHILPGHGGILDRIDSLTAAAPIFLLAWYLIF